MNERRLLAPHTYPVTKEDQKEAIGGRARNSCAPIQFFHLHLSICCLDLPKKRISAHHLQTPTVPTPPRPHALPTPNLLLPPALSPMPASTQPSSPTPAAQHKQPISSSPLRPTLPPQLPPTSTTQFQSPTSPYGLMSASVLVAYSC